jgi:hypothetical protein
LLALGAPEICPRNFGVAVFTAAGMDPSAWDHFSRTFAERARR